MEKSTKRSSTNSAASTELATSTSVLQMREFPISGSKCVIYTTVLFFINLLNYMDRYTIVGVLTDVQKYFNVGDASAGFIQTVFVIFFMVFAPICGFLGDRYNRKIIMIAGLVLWITAVVASSFVPKDMFWMFLLLRGAVGIGEASYSTIAPTIIADLFVLQLRSHILMLFYFAIPIGSGIGFIFGTQAANAFGGWQWGVRVTPPLGIIAIFSLILLIDEPQRGLAERKYYAKMNKDVKEINSTTSVEMKNNEVKIDVKSSNDSFANDSTYVEDIAYLLKKRSYLWLIVGYTTMLFLVGTFSWWAPTIVNHAVAHKKGLNSTELLSYEEKSGIAMIFGVIVAASGFFGVSLGVFIAQMWKSGKGCFSCCPSSKADAYISAFGSLAAAPLLYLCIYLIDKHLFSAWIVMFLAILCLCLNWAVIIDLLMYIIVPWRRNVANSWLMMISHLFGDASGPYIVGAVSDMLHGNDNSPLARFTSLTHSFYVVILLLLISGVSFILAARNLPTDIHSFKEETGKNCKSLNAVREEITERMTQKVPV